MIDGGCKELIVVNLAISVQVTALQDLRPLLLQLLIPKQFISFNYFFVAQETVTVYVHFHKLFSRFCEVTLVIDESNDQGNDHLLKDISLCIVLYIPQDIDAFRFTLTLFALVTLNPFVLEKLVSRHPVIRIFLQAVINKVDCILAYIL